jgi:hypothetical protein
LTFTGLFNSHVTKKQDVHFCTGVKRMKISIASIVGIAMLGISGAAQAATLDDTYWGGVPTVGPETDVVGGNRYSVSSLTAIRSDNSNDLVVTVATNYVYNIGAGGTEIGSLFIGNPADLNLAGSAPAHTTDTFSADTDRFGYVFDFDIDNALVSADSANKSGSLWKLNGDGSDVRRSFGTIFRAGQAVDRTGGTDTRIDGSWSIGAGSITFTISNFFSLTGIDPTALTLAWTMSCANDIILGSVGFNAQGPGEGPDVPLPAGVVLLLSGLAGLGAVGRKKLKKS